MKNKKIQLTLKEKKTLFKEYVKLADKEICAWQKFKEDCLFILKQL